MRRDAKGVIATVAASVLWMASANSSAQSVERGRAVYQEH